jgi:multiple sugar transport system ATP-binding protein
MSYLSLKNVNKVYPGGVKAVIDFNLEVEEGEFIVLVGPSGCGKSTTLRMIAGLEGISSGDMFLQGRRINNAAPSDRDIAMVFQDYALYGNMTVYQNIGFSLTIRGKDDDLIHDRVMNVAQTVRLSEYLNRYPRALSGGQKQRVAMGRSVAKEARVLLMDEPLSNLDAKLRQETRKELAVLHHELNSTIVYVTHDQIEAMTMATRIVVMNEGYIQQIGTPYEVYHYPANIFTAGFIGMPAVNLVRGRIGEGAYFTGLSRDQRPILRAGLSPEQREALGAYREGGLVMGLRPENLRVPGEGGVPVQGGCTISAAVRGLELLGAEYHAVLDLDGFDLSCRIPARREIKTGQRIEAVFDPGRVHFFDEKTGLRINGAGGGSHEN